MLSRLFAHIATARRNISATGTPVSFDSARRYTCSLSIPFTFTIDIRSSLGFIIGPSSKSAAMLSLMYKVTHGKHSPQLSKHYSTQPA